MKADACMPGRKSGIAHSSCMAMNSSAQPQLDGGTRRHVSAMYCALYRARLGITSESSKTLHVFVEHAKRTRSTVQPRRWIGPPGLVANSADTAREASGSEGMSPQLRSRTSTLPGFSGPRPAFRTPPGSEAFVGAGRRPHPLHTLREVGVVTPAQA
jgi:hypothetical protein